MFGTRRQTAGNLVAIFLHLIDAVSEVLHPWVAVFSEIVTAIVAGVPAHLQPVQHIGFGRHIVMLTGGARIA